MDVNFIIVFFDKIHTKWQLSRQKSIKTLLNGWLCQCCYIAFCFCIPYTTQIFLTHSRICLMASFSGTW